MAPAHAVAHVTTSPHPDRLAVTKALTAIDPHRPSSKLRASAGIPVEAWQQVVADAAVGRTLVGVAGTHGKSTTAGWLVHVLVAAGRDPSAFVGALLPADDAGDAPSTARSGSGTVFVVEADEYAGNFDAYRPDVAVLTSAEWDHPDVFRRRRRGRARRSSGGCGTRPTTRRSWQTSATQASRHRRGVIGLVGFARRLCAGGRRPRGPRGRRARRSPSGLRPPPDRRHRWSAG